MHVTYAIHIHAIQYACYMFYTYTYIYTYMSGHVPSPGDVIAAELSALSTT